ncbi:MAG: helix-turn-helix transcriptional regulator [Niastella sp.]|nr:helix-turn-helix transcriptional regulator [Niastella sp.]
MYNVLLRFCRIRQGLDKKDIAAKLGIALSDYKQLEAGTSPLNVKQATILAKLYKTKPSYLLDAADQLETLHTRAQIIQILKSDNERLNELMTEGYELIHESKQRAAEQYS